MKVALLFVKNTKIAENFIKIIIISIYFIIQRN